MDTLKISMFTVATFLGYNILSRESMLEFKAEWDRLTWKEKEELKKMVFSQEEE